MTVEKTTLLIPISVDFKQAIGECAAKQKISMSQFVRQTVAKEVGYELERDAVKLGRPKKDNENKKMINKLLEQFLHETHEANVEALAEWLRKRGHTDV